MITDVLPHSKFKQISEVMWTLEGSLPHGNPLPRTMVVYVMEDGGLWIHSPIALDKETQDELRTFGKPKYIVVPNSMHRLDAPLYKMLYPEAKVICPRAARKKVEEKVQVDGVSEEEFLGSEEVIALEIPGAKGIELAFELLLPDGAKALVVNDLIVNKEHLHGWKGKVMEMLGRVGKFRVPAIQKMFFLDNRKAFRTWLESLARRTDITVVTVAHGETVTERIPKLLLETARMV